MQGQETPIKRQVENLKSKMSAVFSVGRERCFRMYGDPKSYMRNGLIEYMGTIRELKLRGIDIPQNVARLDRAGGTKIYRLADPGILERYS